MPAERLPMRKVREVLRQRYACGASERVIAQSLGIGRTAVGEYIRRAAVIGITWPVPGELDDAALERKLFAPAGYNPPQSKPLPDWAHVHAELRRRSVTLALLWQDYRRQHPDGYGYSRFCDLYGEWRRGVTATMRQAHAAGEKLFVDFAGDTMPVFDAITGEVRDTKIFVAVLGALNYTYAEARFSEGLPDWIGAHVNALAFLGGVPKAIVCDNLKAGVTTASRYEPGENRTYQDLATHYGTTIMPTRPRKPRDKAKVEGAVLIVERWILARLRDRRFFALAELNIAIHALVDELNARRCASSAPAAGSTLRPLIGRPGCRCPANPINMPNGAAPASPWIITSSPWALLLRAVPVSTRWSGCGPPRPPSRCSIAACAGKSRALVRRRRSTITPSICRVRTVGMPSGRGAPARRCQKGLPFYGGAVRGNHAGEATSGTGVPFLPRHPLARPFRCPVRLEAACRRGVVIGAASYRSIASILKTGLEKAFMPIRNRTPNPFITARSRPWRRPLTNQKETHAG